MIRERFLRDRLPIPFLLLALALVFSSSCAPPRPSGPEMPGERVPLEAAEARRELYESSAARDRSDGPYRVNASLRFGREGDVRRVLLLIWGNGDAGDSGSRETIRLDVMAGLGPLLARLREGPEGFTAYVPQERRALVYRGSGSPRFNPGMPLPFGLSDVADLLRGRFLAVFGSLAAFSASDGAGGVRPPVWPVWSDAGHPVYALAKTGDRLELDESGRPIRWEEAGGWTMRLDYEDGAARPFRLRLEHPEAGSAILLVKKSEAPKPFTEEQMALTLPPDTAMQAIFP